MIALIQRVQEAEIVVEKQTVGKISKGLLVFLGIAESDTQENSKSWLIKSNDRVLKMMQENESQLLDCSAELLVVSQFTLFQTSKGWGPSFSHAASPKRQDHETLRNLQQHQIRVASGVFGVICKFI